MKTADPEIEYFVINDVKGQDKVTIHLGPEVAIIATCKWERDENGNAIAFGESHSVTIPRHSLIGWAYELLHNN